MDHDPAALDLLEPDREDTELGVPRDQLEGLGNHLVWKMGKDEITERVVVRVGYASATGSFRDLPKLRSANDSEIAEAAKNGELVVEWIE
jgi:hypothetical protein